MSVFSEAVSEFWRRPFAGVLLHRTSDFSLTVNAELNDDERITVLWTESDGHTAVAVHPNIAKSLRPSLTSGSSLNVNHLRAAVSELGIALHPADNVYYLAREDFKHARAESVPSGIRRLGPGDADIFAEFKACVLEQDLDNAQVDLDDWVVFGVLDPEDRILCVGSMYPWVDEAALVDIGVVTRSDVRGQGHARRLVRAMCRHALNSGYEPQYRCQLDNAASIALAASSGLSLFGRWEIVTPDATSGL